MRLGRIVSPAVVIAIALTLGVGTATAALAPGDTKCRQKIGKAVKKLSDTLLKETASCHKKRMLGQLPSSTDCNDPLQLPGASKVQRAADKVVTDAERGCLSAAIPQSNGYVVCRAPCNGIAITDYTDVGACLSCLTKDEVGVATIDVLGLPASPASNNDATKCQVSLGTALRKYMVTRIGEQQKCQFGEDKSPLGLDCMTADLRGKIARALTTARLKVGTCQAAAFAQLDTCGATVSQEQACLEAAANAGSDQIFIDVYQPVEPVFVSTNIGSPTGDGSILDPLQTIAAGLAKAQATGAAAVVVDKGSYAESVTLISGVAILGGFNSDVAWIRDASPTTIFGGTTAVVGTSVSNVVVEGFTIDAADNTAVGGSSYGIRLINSTNVIVRDSIVLAGKAGDGSNGSAGAPGVAGADAASGDVGCEEGGHLQPFCGSCSRPDGGNGAPSSCGAAGGGGGGTGSHCENGAGTSGQSGQGAGLGGNGGVNGGIACNGSVTPGSNGFSGGNGPAGGNGGGGASFGGTGTLYGVANGVNGVAAGTAGGGGGGGGGGSAGRANIGECYSYGGGGGGGGAGGCGGQPGVRGTGAGGSFGVWVSASTVELDGVSISTGNGGKGGNGGAGGIGGPAGSGGFGGLGEDFGGDASGRGGNGGNGGAGGRGGHAGGGGGGPSIGVVCAGSPVVRSSLTFSLGAAGAGGSSSGSAGATGLRVNEHGC